MQRQGAADGFPCRATHSPSAKATPGVKHQVMSVNYIGVIRGGEPVAMGKTK
jgi:hypothetical protein